ncbi:winged helix-turn-helix domain-containing protein [Defluviimonas aestuarii]|uniref:winged helix-turn-helix domain-containing protein n=1 Tax=Albidovulum aestuarii TaxID=1130726 RepID=UPI00249B7A3A|nr:winged helix-turn-helix domain-containing protein [Defluviimonas aestuarii]MDI3338551.1 winged helix-turn-helix domain-containing protein [Defluviimonas aestuarii]
MKYLFQNGALEVGARSLSLGSEELHVEPQVFDLILYLVENRSRVVGKDELIARVWKGRIVSDATIASRINAARKALGDDGRRQSFIATHSRQGFKFVGDVTIEGDTSGRPALAVLPFLLTNGEGASEHLARGLAEQLAASLGQAGWFDVCDTTASFASALAGLAPKDVAARLKVGYLVLGTLHATAEHLRLDLRLISSDASRQMWSGRFDAPRGDIFGLQDSMAEIILGEVEPRLRSVELQRSEARHGNLTAFDHYLRAQDLLRVMDLPSMRAACIELDKAISAYPSYGAAYGMRAWIATLLLPQGQRVDPRVELQRSRMAVTEGAFDCDALAMGGYALGYFDRHPDTGIDYVRRALAINPSSARAHDHLAWLLLYTGRSAEALEHFDRALTLCPIDEFSFRMRTGRAFALLYQRDFEGAVRDGYRAHAVAPEYSVCHRVLAASLAHIGREKESRRIAKELLTLNPGLTIARFARDTRFEGPKDRELLFQGLKMAGLR